MKLKTTSPAMQAAHRDRIEKLRLHRMKAVQEIRAGQPLAFWLEEWRQGNHPTYDAFDVVVIVEAILATGA